MNVGERFGRLVTTGRVQGAGREKWACLCDCGANVTVLANNLKTGNTSSCGCLNIQRILERNHKHGLARSSEYESWQGAKKRCFNPTCKHYANYGGRGITMYVGWVNDFQAFYEHIGPKPDYEQRWSVGRIDNNGNYEPGNVRWETDNEQARNRRISTRNKTGVLGVSYREGRKGSKESPIFLAVVTYKKQNKTKSFSIRKYGYDEALRLASEWREKELKNLELLGVVYAESHGK